MILLTFAFLSGLVTILAPCIWPLLPIVLSSAAGGRKKSLGIVLGVMLSFAFFTLSISYLVKILPINPNSLRLISVVIILFLGLTIIIPSLSKRVEGWVSNLSGRFSGRFAGGGGFGVGFLTGVSLGIVWSPCAGPILATIATLAAARAVSGQLVFVTLSYCLGIGIPLFIFALVGSHIFQNSKFISPYTGRVQQIFGVIMILTALAIFTNYDKVLELKLLNIFPSYTNLLLSLEINSKVTGELGGLKSKQNSLPAAEQAPDFIGITKWLNLPDNKDSLSLKDLRGKVVLVDFWTYTCINCIRTLPFVTSWYDKYSSNGFVVVGIHTPEFEFEKNSDNVLSAIKQFGIHYPVAQDNNYQTWNAYSNQYWPAEYLIDASGNIRRTHFGEGEYDETEKAIQELLKEKGATISSRLTNKVDQTPSGNISPETYLGSLRMLHLYPNGRVGNGTQNFTPVANLPINAFSFGGSWNITDEKSQAGVGASIDYHFYASKIFLVMRAKSGGEVRVYLDGKLTNNVIVDADKLYTLVELKKNEEHLLHIEVPSGVEVFAFTFG